VCDFMSLLIFCACIYFLFTCFGVCVCVCVFYGHLYLCAMGPALSPEINLI